MAFPTSSYWKWYPSLSNETPRATRVALLAPAPYGTCSASTDRNVTLPLCPPIAYSQSATRTSASAWRPMLIDGSARQRFLYVSLVAQVAVLLAALSR